MKHVEDDFIREAISKGVKGEDYKRYAYEIGMNNYTYSFPKYRFVEIVKVRGSIVPFEAELRYVEKVNGFSFMGEYAHRTADNPIATNLDGSLTGDVVLIGDGLNLQTGYLFHNNWEVSGRYTNIKLDEEITGRNPQDQYTLGFSKYIVGHKLKVQTDLSYLSEDGDQDRLMYRLQLEVHF